MKNSWYQIADRVDVIYTHQYIGDCSIGVRHDEVITIRVVHCIQGDAASMTNLIDHVIIDYQSITAKCKNITIRIPHVSAKYPNLNKNTNEVDENTGL